MFTNVIKEATMLRYRAILLETNHKNEVSNAKKSPMKIAHFTVLHPPAERPPADAGCVCEKLTWLTPTEGNRQ